MNGNFSKSSYHHILPNSLFEIFSNLSENPWNGTHLLYSDHYYAHWLITEAVQSSKMLSAFCGMHQQDVKNKRIKKEDLIPPLIFQTKLEERGRNTSELFNSTEWKETKGKIRNARHSATKNSKEWKDTIGKKQKRKVD